MNDTQLTVTGWLGTDVTTRQAGDSLVASFRLAATPRRLNRTTGEWYDDDTQWFTVNAWRALGDNCAASLRRGDPVVVHGRLSVSRWTNPAGVEMVGHDLEAAFVGHDLNRGRSSFVKAPRAVQVGGAEPVRQEEEQAAPATPAISGTKVEEAVEAAA